MKVSTVIIIGIMAAILLILAVYISTRQPSHNLPGSLLPKPNSSRYYNTSGYNRTGYNTSGYNATGAPGR